MNLSDFSGSPRLWLAMTLGGKPLVWKKKDWSELFRTVVEDISEEEIEKLIQIYSRIKPLSLRKKILNLTESLHADEEGCWKFRFCCRDLQIVVFVYNLYIGTTK